MPAWSRCGERLKAKIASISDDEIARPQVGNHRCGAALIGAPPIRHDEVVALVRE